MIEEAAEEELPAFDLLDFIQEDEDLFVAIIRVKFKVSLRNRGQVANIERKKPVVFKVDIQEAFTGDGSYWMGAKMINELMD